MKISSAVIYISGSLCILCSNFLVQFASSTQALPKPAQNLKGGVKKPSLQQTKSPLPSKPPKPLNDKLKDDSNKTETKDAKNGLNKPPKNINDKVKDGENKTPSQDLNEPSFKLPMRQKESSWYTWLKGTKKDYETLKCFAKGNLYDWLCNVRESFDLYLQSLEKKWTTCSDSATTLFLCECFAESSGWNDSQWGNWMNNQLKEQLKTEAEAWISTKKKDFDGLTSKYFSLWKDHRRKELDADEWKNKVSSGGLSEWEELTNKMNTRYRNNLDNMWSHFSRDLFFNFDEWAPQVLEKWIENKQWNRWVKKVRK
ncbi:tryptophan-rich antigen [Plasmodium vivax]|uniref:Tryptophan-rich antigen n=1 Tax=Plasmodium vivax TaxID=5855 RepID=A0A1G4EG87_PLAVI|nr:tryptophan-rich antigen [Plasmodium vivax]